MTAPHKPDMRVPSEDDWGLSEWPTWILVRNAPLLGIRFGRMYGGYWCHVVYPPPLKAQGDA